ncbi:MAG: serine/threonine protein phosphatase [halophilic archaeon J07HX64]|jgi:Serine/threonine protein phosphatase|nr:MAG: serine/threonine protein phosphatase [halophilic archaeon J07HX64]
MGVKTTASTDVGLVRDHNEDSVYSGTREDGDVGLLAVADGMGGHRAGDVASEAAIDAFVEYVETHSWERSSESRQELLGSAARAANTSLREKVAENPELDGMGTTLVGAILADGEVTLVNVGDSRGYHIHGGDIEQVTTDQSLVQQLVETGQIEPEEADDHPQKHVLSQALGTGDEVEPDTYHLPLGGVLLLCSDGLSDEVPDSEIHDSVAEPSSIDDAAESLVELANERDGSDNVGVALAREV